MFSPDVILTHHYGDLNIDHQKTFEAVTTACRPLKNETVKTIITFEIPSSTDWQMELNSKQFKPNLYLILDKENVESRSKQWKSTLTKKETFLTQGHQKPFHCWQNTEVWALEKILQKLFQL